MQYKNLYTYKDFLNEKNQLNEGLFGFLKKMLNKMKDYAKQIKESDEIDSKYEEAKTKLDKLFNDKLEDMIIVSNKKTQVEKPTSESLISEAQTQTVEKEEKYDNPIDEAIGTFIKDTKEQMKAYLTSENKKVQLYAQAKISELNQYVQKKKIDIYKAKKAELGEEKLKELMIKAEEKMKEEEEIGKKIMGSLSKIFGDKKGEEPTFEVDKKYNYTTEDKKETTITVKEVEDSGKSVVKAINADGIEINPETSRIKPITQKEDKSKEIKT